MKTWWKKSAHWMSQRDHVDPCDLLADLPSGVRASQSGLQEGKYFLHAWFLSMASTDVASDDQSLLRPCSTLAGLSSTTGSWRSSPSARKSDGRLHLLLWLSKPTSDVRTSKTIGCPSTSSGPKSPRCLRSATTLQAEPSRSARQWTTPSARAIHALSAPATHGPCACALKLDHTVSNMSVHGR
jgi:hypothetical protein